MRCESWKDFEGQEGALVDAPDAWRFAMRLRPRQGRFFLKLTDNRKALKFHTSKGLYLNRIEQSTANLVRRLQRRPTWLPPQATKTMEVQDKPKAKKKDKKKK